MTLLPYEVGKDYDRQDDIHRIYRGQDRHREAIAAYKRAIRDHPDYARAHLGMGRCYALLGKDDDALAAWRIAARLDPDGKAGKEARESIELLREKRRP